MTEHWLIDIRVETRKSGTGEAGLEDSHQGIGLIRDCTSGIYGTDT